MLTLDLFHSKNRSLNEFDHDTVTSVEFYGESAPSAVRSSYQTQCLGTQRKVASGCDLLCLVGVPWWSELIWIDLNYCSTKYRKIIWSNWAKKWDARDEIAPFAPFVQSSQSIFDSQSLQSDSFGWDYRTKWPFFVSLGFCFNHQTADWGSLFLGSLFLGVPGVSLGCPWGRPWRSRQGTLSTYLMQQLERECEAICAVASVASERLRPRLPQRPRRNGKFDTENLGTWEWNWESDDYNIL